LSEELEKGLNFFIVTPEATPLSHESEVETCNINLPTDAVSVPLTIPVDTQTYAGVTSAAEDIDPPQTAMRTAEEIDDTEEPYTLRTKTMADVLAGQSDISGALEIYHELAVRAESFEERREINERIAQLSSQQAEAGDTPPSSSSDAPPSGKQRMQHLLESLAERLEARALG
jgi:hypothetical protein